jgi:hypothetical protein
MGRKILWLMAGPTAVVETLPAESHLCHHWLHLAETFGW